MPSINQSRKVHTVALPNIEGSEVKVFDNLTVGDLEELQALPDAKKMAFACLRLIQSWNLEEEITIENIKKLDNEQYLTLMNVTSFYKDALKKLEELQDEQAQKKTI